MAGTYYYGLLTPPNDTENRLLRVWVNSDSGHADCKAAGLISQHEFCWGDLETFDSYLEFEQQSSLIAPGLSSWYLAKNLDYRHVRWCKKFEQHSATKLVDMAIPGSHDSGTSQSQNNYIADHFNVTQDWSIVNQLILGVRYLDLRCTRAGNGTGSEDGGIWTHHSGYKGEKLERALNGVKLFLQKNPSEFVLVYLSHEQNISRAEVEAEILRVMGSLATVDPLPGLFEAAKRHTPPPAPTLLYADDKTTYADARGKLLVIQEPNLRRNVAPEANNQGGEDGFYEWPAKQTWLDTIPRDLTVFNLFEAQLTGRVSEPGGASYPITLAGKQRAGFTKWMKSAASNNIAILSNDWFGTASDVADGIALVIAKNNARLPKATAASEEVLSLG